MYSYPPAEEGGTGARYEGEWRDNLKDGRGVYYFPKGGTYEGEWSGGGMNGVGVRTFSTGQVSGLGFGVQARNAGFRLAFPAGCPPPLPHRSLQLLVAPL